MKLDVEIVLKLVRNIYTQYDEGGNKQYPEGHPFAGAWQDSVYRAGYQHALSGGECLPPVTQAHKDFNPDFKMGMEDAEFDYEHYKERLED